MAVVIHPEPPRGLWDEYPLHCAVHKGSSAEVRRLISSGRSVNEGTFDNVTPLHDACLRGYIDCVEILIDAGAIINARNVDGSTPLCDAAAGGNLDCVRLLLQHGADLNPELCLTTPLHEAVMSNHVDIIEVLIEAGVRLDVSDLHYGTPLHLACFKNHLHAAATLLRAGANVNAVKMHQTSLHISARSHNVALVALLLDHGASVHAKNNWGKTAKDLAQGSEDVSNLLDYWGRNTPRLVQLCRIATRRVLGPSRLKHIGALGLPPTASKFLQYQNWRPLSDTWSTSCITKVACT